jgi:arginyl-tRNA synthetase
MQNPKELIEKSLKNWLEENSITTDFEVSLVDNPVFGDFSTNIAMVAVKKQSEFVNPRELADKLVVTLKDDSNVNKVFDKIEVAGPGFINFFLSQNYLQNMLSEIAQKGNDYGRSDTKNEQVVIVEYSSPNIAKPFTIGHLRSTIIGDAIANLLEAQGYIVKRDNHLGDWGSQFGKQIYAIKTWGNIEDIEKSENPVKDLVALYIKFHEEAERDPSIEDKAREWFKKLEEGDKEARELWERCISWSMKEFGRIYSILGVEFTENSGLGYGESFFEDKMQPVLEELRSKNLLVKSEGAELVFFPDNKYPPLMLLKKDGTTLYATRDLATDQFRLEMYPEVKIINEVGIEQELYFKQLFELEKLLGWVVKGQRIHIKHGHYRFKEGKMSTRKGNVIWLEDVLEEARKRAFALSNQTHELDSDSITTTSNKQSIAAASHNPGFAEKSNNAEKIAIGAIKWNDLKRDSKQDVTFDWDEILNMQGNSGPYLQYTYVRTQSVLSKSNYELGNMDTGVTTKDWELETEEYELLRFLAQFKYVVLQAAEDFAPNLLCNYLFELSQRFNLFYQKHKIIGSENEIFRLELTNTTGQVIRNGLHILGIETVEKM